jgi:membrane protease YdiL (CAAX protease family)
MNYSISEINEHLEIVLSLGLTTLGFIVYWFLAESKKVATYFTKGDSGEKTEVKRVVFQKMVGVIFLGLLPTIVCLLVFPYTLAEYGLNFKNFGDSLYYTGILACLIIPLTLFSARKKDTQEMYPQMRIERWTAKLVFTNSLNWALYLFAYEFLFRGILFMLIYPKVGVIPAIAINTAIYSCTHIPKGMKEALSAIPFGIVLCLLTLETSTIWIAFLAHLVLALSNDYGAIFFSPTKRFVFGKRES